MSENILLSSKMLLTPSDVNALVCFLLFEKTPCPDWFQEFQVQNLKNLSFVVLENTEKKNDVTDPPEDGFSVLRELASGSSHDLEIRSQKFSKNTIKEHLLISKDDFHTIRINTTPFVEKVSATCTYTSDLIDRTELVLDADEIYNGNTYSYSTTKEQYTYSVPTSDVYSTLTKNSPMFAIDCEMCLTTANKRELTRIAVVDERQKVVYDTLVKPINKITDYLTKYSGITEQMLKNTKTTLSDVQHKLRELLPNDAILVGHSIHCDLAALDMYHPYCIDTSLVFNLTGVPSIRPGLKLLAETFLKVDIQNKGIHGHSPVEDAKTSMLLVKYKLNYGMNFGNVAKGFEMSSKKRIENLVKDFYEDMLESVETAPGNALSETSLLEMVQMRFPNNVIIMEDSLFHSNSIYQNVRSNDTVHLEDNIEAVFRQLRLKLTNPPPSKKFTYAHLQLDAHTTSFYDYLNACADHIIYAQSPSNSSSLHLTLLVDGENSCLLVNKQNTG